jgi:hypothetical protein
VGAGAGIIRTKATIVPSARVERSFRKDHGCDLRGGGSLCAGGRKMTDRRGSGEVEGFGQPDRRQLLHRAKIKIRDANMDQYASPPDLLSLVALMLSG